MFQAIIEIPEGATIKDKRQVLRSLLERLRRSFRISAAEVDLNDSLAFAQVGGALVSNSREFGEKVMAKVIKTIEDDLACRIHSYQVHSESFEQ